MSQATSMDVFREADAAKTPDEVKARDQEILDALKSNHSGDGDAAYALAGLVQHFPTLGVFKLHDGTSFLDMLTPAASAPATAASTGSKGQFWLHATGIDICVATDTWLRISGVSF